MINRKSGNDCIIFWDLQKNIEKHMYDVGKDYILVWDQNGYPYIITKEKTIFVRQQYGATVFNKIDFDMIKLEASYPNISTGKGIRFDGRNHNWLLLLRQLDLGFSYMTFVIKDSIEK